MSAWISPIRCVECDRRSRFGWDTSTNTNNEPLIVRMREHDRNVYSFVCVECATEEK